MDILERKEKGKRKKRMGKTYHAAHFRSPIFHEEHLHRVLKVVGPEGARGVDVLEHDSYRPQHVGLLLVWHEGDREVLQFRFCSFELVLCGQF